MSKPISEMTNDELVADYLQARSHVPLLVERVAHSKRKLALKDQITQRGLTLPAGIGKKATGYKLSAEGQHQSLVACHGRQFAPYDGPKGHPVREAEIDETVPVENQPFETTAEVVELVQPAEPSPQAGSSVEQPRQMAAMEAAG